MDNSKAILKLFRWVAILFSWALSLFLTTNLTLQIFSDGSPAWIGVGVVSGVLLNLSEITLLIYGKQHRNKVSGILAFVFCAVLALVSISASVGALETGFQRNAEKSTAYQTQRRAIALQDSIIASLSKTADRQRQLKHVTRSAQTLQEAQAAIEAMKADVKKLDEIQEEGIGVSAALFNVYAKMFNKKSGFIRGLFVIIISTIIELLMIFFSAIQIEESDKKQLAIEGIFEENDQGFIYRGVQYFLNQAGNDATNEPAIARQNESERQVGFELDSKPVERVKIVSKTVHEPEFLNDIHEREKPFTLTKKNVPDGVQESVQKAVHRNVPNDVQNDDNLNGNYERFREIYNTKFRGKTDPFILYVFDNWNKLTDVSFSYLKLTRAVSSILPGKKNRVSKTHCYNVIQANRKGEDNATK